MAEPMREGTPAQEGWYRITTTARGNIITSALFWNHGKWWSSEEMLSERGCVETWEGPLVLQPEPSQTAVQIMQKWEHEYAINSEQDADHDRYIIRSAVSEAYAAGIDYATKQRPEPSQGARERMLTIIAEVEDKYGFEFNQTVQWIIEREITAAEQAACVPLLEQIELLNADLHSAADRFQAAYQLGREEEREHWKTICDEVSHNNGNQHPIRTATALGIKLRAEGKIPPWPSEATDQPAQPGEPHKATTKDFGKVIKKMLQDDPALAQKVELEQEIANREQEIYEEGREEGRREEREKWELMIAELKRIGKLHKDVRFFDHTDQPAQPVERVIFCDVCGPNPETILLPDKFGTMQVFCKACHKSGQPAEPTIHVEKLCHCVRLWDGLWGSLALDEIGIYGNTGKAKKDCPDCGGTGRKPQPAESESSKYKPPQGGSGTAEPKIVTGTASDRLNDLERRVQRLEERTTGQIRYGGPTT